MAQKMDKPAEKRAEQRSDGIAAKAAAFKEYLEESKAEIKKVVWPTRKETVATCIAVLALVAVMAVYLGLVDLGLTHLVKYILS